MFPETEYENADPTPNCALGPTWHSRSKRKMFRDVLSPLYLHIHSHLPSLCWPQLQCRTWHPESAASEEFLRSPRLNMRSGMSLQRQHGLSSQHLPPSYGRPPVPPNTGREWAQRPVPHTACCQGLTGPRLSIWISGLKLALLQPC